MTQGIASKDIRGVDGETLYEVDGIGIVDGETLENISKDNKPKTEEIHKFQKKSQ